MDYVATLASSITRADDTEYTVKALEPGQPYVVFGVTAVPVQALTWGVSPKSRSKYVERGKGPQGDPIYLRGIRDAV
jgi:hypothetical protein